MYIFECNFLKSFYITVSIALVLFKSAKRQILPHNQLFSVMQELFVTRMMVLNQIYNLFSWCIYLCN